MRKRIISRQCREKEVVFIFLGFKVLQVLLEDYSNFKKLKGLEPNKRISVNKNKIRQVVGINAVYKNFGLHVSGCLKIK